MSVSVHNKDENSLESPMPGKVLQVLVASGDTVEEEQPLVIIEAMKMEFMVRAPHSGTVVQVHYAAGDQVAVGDILVRDGQSHRVAEMSTMLVTLRQCGVLCLSILNA